MVNINHASVLKCRRCGRVDSHSLTRYQGETYCGECYRLLQQDVMRIRGEAAVDEAFERNWERDR